MFGLPKMLSPLTIVKGEMQGFQTPDNIWADNFKIGAVLGSGWKLQLIIHIFPRYAIEKLVEKKGGFLLSNAQKDNITHCR